MQVSGLLVAGVLLSAFCLVPSKSSASASTATWPTPSPALQTATPLFRKMKGYRCKDRNEICTQAEPPCQEAKANLDECRELCASIYECTSFEFKANKVCRLSTTCTEALMVRGPTREDLYLKQPPPDPRYPGLVSRDLGQVTEVGDYSCVSSGKLSRLPAICAINRMYHRGPNRWLDVHQRLRVP